MLKDTIDIEANLTVADKAVLKFVNNVQTINKIGMDNIKSLKRDVKTLFISLPSIFTNNNEMIDVAIINKISFIKNTKISRIKKHASFT